MHEDSHKHNLKPILIDDIYLISYEIAKKANPRYVMLELLNFLVIQLKYKSVQNIVLVGNLFLSPITQ
jgi:hypothetical protein